MPTSHHRITIDLDDQTLERLTALKELHGLYIIR